VGSSVRERNSGERLTVDERTARWGNSWASKFSVRRGGIRIAGKKETGGGRRGSNVGETQSHGSWDRRKAI